MNQDQEVFKKNCGNEGEFILCLIMILSFFIAELFFRTATEVSNMNILILAAIELFIWISLSLSISIYYYNKKYEVII